MDALAGYGSDEGDNIDSNSVLPSGSKTDNSAGTGQKDEKNLANGDKIANKLSSATMKRPQTSDHVDGSSKKSAAQYEERELDRSLKPEISPREASNGQITNQQAKTSDVRKSGENKRREKTKHRSRSRSKSTHRSSRSKSRSPDKNYKHKGRLSHSREHSRSPRSRTRSRSPSSSRRGQKHSSSRRGERRSSRGSSDSKKMPSDPHRYRRRSRSHSNSRRRSHSKEKTKRKSRSRSHERSRRSRSRSRTRHHRRSRSRDRSSRYRSRSKEKHSKRHESKSSKTESGETKQSTTSEPLKKSPDKVGEAISKLPLAGNSGICQMTPQLAVQQAMAAVNAKAQQLTGISLPKYYNPAAVNPMKYAEQMQKRKLLWGCNKEKVDPQIGQTSNNKWESTTFAQDQDGKMTAKFRKLMGIRPGGGASEESPVLEGKNSTANVSDEQIRKQEEMFRNLDQQYEVARMSTHTHRGVGLGFTSQAHHLFPK